MHFGRRAHLGYFLVWVLLFSPPFLIHPSLKEAGYTLLSAFVFFPLAMKRPWLGAACAVLLPVGAANMLHASFLHSLIDEFTLATLLRTEAQETQEFFENLDAAQILQCLAWLAAALAAAAYLWRHCLGLRWTMTRKAQAAWALPAVLWLGLGLTGMVQHYNAYAYAHKLRHFYPMQMGVAALRFGELSQSVFYTPKLPSPATGKPMAHTLVVVIGESASSHRWSLLGYTKEDTNSALRSVPHLGVHALLANGQTTAKALPFILTGQSAATSLQTLAPSFVDLARHAGFKTFVFSNSRFFEKSEDLYTQMLRRSADVYQKVGNGAYDEVLTAPLARALADPAEYKLIVLHTYGSHPDVHKRYPKARYRGEDPYDTSIRYTSDLLAQWIAMLDGASRLPGLLFYVSDHGLSTPPCVEGFHHSVTRSTYEVPMLSWANAAFRAQHPGWLEPGYQGQVRHSTTLLPFLVAQLQGYEPSRALPQWQDSRLLQVNGRPYEQLFRQDVCTP